MKYLMALAILLLGECVYAACGVSDVLPVLAPNSQWAMTNDDFSTIRWIGGVKPTAQQVKDAVASCKTDEENRAILKARARYEVKLSTVSAVQRLQDLLLLLDLDK